MIGHSYYFKKFRVIINEHDRARNWKLLCQIERTYYTY